MHLNRKWKRRHMAWELLTQQTYLALQTLYNGDLKQRVAVIYKCESYKRCYQNIKKNNLTYTKRRITPSQFKANCIYTWPLTNKAVRNLLLLYAKSDNNMSLNIALNRHRELIDNDNYREF